MTYANKTSVSPLEDLRDQVDDVQKSSEIISAAYNGVQTNPLTPVTIEVASAMPPRSAPMFTTFATTQESASAPHTQLDKSAAKLQPVPRPLPFPSARTSAAPQPLTERKERRPERRIAEEAPVTE